ncbi:MAG TPA: diol dehydratase small subunit [Anaerolineae bacterium]|nr:diol dehydratase small subunit [Anaerolineae bacterium]
MCGEVVRTASGRSLDELTMEALLSGELTTEDFRISGETLRRQADAAEEAGYRALADNLRRAAELTTIANEEVLRIYDALRPGRSTYGELIALADRLAGEHNAPLIADLVREAAEVYRERGIVKRG